MDKIVEFTPEMAMELFDECPQPGDTFTHKGKKAIIKKVDVINNSKLMVMVYPYREVKRYDKPLDSSVLWNEFDESFFPNENEEENDSKFIDKNTLKE